MYAVSPRAMYVMQHALEDARNVARMERMVRAMGREPAEVVTITPDQLPQVIESSGWIGEVRQGAYPEHHDPDIVFSAFTWPAPDERAALATSDLHRACVEAHNRFGDCKQNYVAGRVLAMLGAGPHHHYESRPDWDPALVCWTLHDIHSAWGCLHRCAYCQRGSVYTIMLNVEEFADRVERLVEENPWQKTFRYDVEQDVLCIEPEYGACEMLVERFTRLDGRYLILFSKSANVDFLLPLAHGGKTIMLWTLSTHSVSRRLEPRTATMEQRIEAACKCREAGYPVRFKLKPIIPLKGWREEATAMLELLFDRLQPENLSMEMLFFDSVEEMDAAIGLDNLEPQFVEAAWEAQRRPAPWSTAREGQRPFPCEVKEQVYRHYLTEARRISPDTPVTLCAETQRMWERMGDLVSGKPWDYVCNCGPHCTPGLRTLPAVEGPDAERVRAAREAGGIQADQG